MPSYAIDDAGGLTPVTALPPHVHWTDGTTSLLSSVPVEEAFTTPFPFALPPPLNLYVYPCPLYLDTPCLDTFLCEMRCTREAADTEAVYEAAVEEECADEEEGWASD